MKLPKTYKYWEHAKLSPDEETMLMSWIRKPHANFKDKALQLDVAVHLAKLQKLKPTLDSVLYSVLQDGACVFDDLGFDDWAFDYGCSPDSIKARETYDQCQKTGLALVRALGRDQIAQLREEFQDY